MGVLPYRLCDEVSYCRIDDYLVFLDIHRDRYFRLPSALEHTFLAHMDGNGCLGADIDRLVKSGVLTDLPPVNRATRQSIEDPSNSAVEQTTVTRNLTLGQLLETAAATLSTRWQLRTRALKDVLAAMRDYRDRHATSVTFETAVSIRQGLVDATAIFRRARLYVPVDTSCLLDSIAMVKFLARKGLSARVVFGVACDPFSAHCWVQVGNLVLNDTVGNAKLHTPIRVI